MSLAHLRPLGFGEILDGAFTLYRRHFLTLFLTTAVTFAPLAITQALMVSAMSTFEATPEAAPELGMLVPLMVISMLLFVVSWAAVTRQLAQAYTGGTVSFGDGLRSGVRAFLPLVGAGLLAYFGFLIPMAVVFAVLVPALGGGGAASAMVALVVGIVVFIGFGILTAMLFGVVPAVVVERTGPWKAIQRSRILSKGARLRILTLYVVSWLIIVLPMFGVMAAAGTLGALSDPASAAAMSPGALFLQQALGFFSGTLTFPFFVGCMVLMYFDRRVRTEAMDLEAAADRLPVPA